MGSSTRCGVALCLMVIGITGCICAPRVVPVAAEITFAAHSDHCGIVVDRMGDEQRGMLMAAGSLPFSGGPQWLFQVDRTTKAAVWPQDSQTIVRRTPETASPLLGQVEAAWENLAIRLTLRTADDSWFRTGIFHRIDGRVAPAALGYPATSQLDVRGVYRAELVDAQGQSVGWLRVQISPYQAAPRIYDGVLPAPLNGALGAAAVARLESEIDWLETHAANPYVGQDASRGGR